MGIRQGVIGWIRRNGYRRLAPLGVALAVVACEDARGDDTTEPQASRADEVTSCGWVARGIGPAGTLAVRAETVASGLEVPWGLAFLPSGDILVTERAGSISLVREGEFVREVASVRVASTGEGGLLGLVLHPSFAQNRLFYVYATVSTASGPVNRILRYRLDTDGSAATLDRVIFDGIPAAAVHDGGRLRIGPDGMLYATTGDSRVPSRAQSVSSPAGKILRMTLDGRIPRDNPWSGSAAFVTGVRNAQGLDWFADGALAVADHGPSGDLNLFGRDEINVATRGANLGWPEITACETEEGKVTPSLAWGEAVAPGGAAFYTGTRIPAWRGSLLVGMLKGEHLHRVSFDPRDRQRVLAHDAYFVRGSSNALGRIREVIMSPDGELYLTTSNCDGRGTCPRGKDRIVRVVP